MIEQERQILTMAILMEHYYGNDTNGHYYGGFLDDISMGETIR